ncbi:MAG: hypothetical protein IT303_07730 [Dehalococcoidia bacterium]|nr:hypothetical protein [Dehalococcoidia bacterium]
MAATFITKPLRGMGTGLGRFVLLVLKLGGFAVAAAALILVLDRILLTDDLEPPR